MSNPDAVPYALLAALYVMGVFVVVAVTGLLAVRFSKDDDED